MQRNTRQPPSTSTGGTKTSRRPADIHVGGRIAAGRNRMGWTPAQAATNFAIAADNLALMEAGELRPSAEELYAIATVLRVSLSYFFEDRITA